MIASFWVELGDPSPELSDDPLAVAFAEFDAGAVPDTIDGVFEVVEQVGDGLAVDFDRLLEWFLLVDHAVDAAVFVVAAGVTEVVLEVANDDVVPVRDIEGAIFAEFDVSEAEIFVASHDEIFFKSSPDLAEAIVFRAKAFAVKLEVLEAEETNHVTVDIVLLDLIREVGTGDDGTIGGGTDEPVTEGVGFEALALLAYLNRPSAGAVLSVVITPVIETGAVGIR